ncbi:MAG: cytochrome-c peroxidase [Sphingobacterium sp.]|jgi:cytochrome c peroxidase|nr:cytochrome-c peroxidase [Sphingobacterium sp.]
MKKTIVFSLFGSVLFLLSFIEGEEIFDIAKLRRLYSSGDTSRWPEPHLDDAVKSGFQDIGVLPKVAYPDYNPYSKEKEILGKLLFFDPRMSVSKQISCSNCHDAQLGFGDGKSLAHGHGRRVGKRNAMTLYNVGHYTSFMWDGRASTLEDQMLLPVQDSVEMHTDLLTMLKHITDIEGYKQHFKAAFGTEEITIERIQYAIATFERSINSYPSRFDKFISGNDKLLSDAEVLGLHLFRTKARCINCHNTPLFSDNKFHNDGQTLYGTSQEDFGHYHISRRQEDIGAFRTPSLRDIALSGPWMHHGNFPTLRDVVELYNLGNPAPIQRRVKVDESKRPIHSPLLKKLNLTTEEVDAVLAFLQALSSSTQRRIAQPVLPL